MFVEACVTSLMEAKNAAAAGANRVELCHDLDVGGLTPELDLVQRVARSIHIPVNVMVRDRAGAFTATPGELSDMKERISDLYRAGASGFVFGVLTPNGAIDSEAVGTLVEAAGGQPVTFHRAFDELDDHVEGLERLVELGVTTVLTSGGANSAWQGRGVLRALVEQARGRIQVLGGGSVRGHTVTELVHFTGLDAVHARAEAIPDIVSAVEGRDR